MLPTIAMRMLALWELLFGVNTWEKSRGPRVMTDFNLTYSLPPPDVLLPSGMDWQVHGQHIRRRTPRPDIATITNDELTRTVLCEVTAQGSQEGAAGPSDNSRHRVE